MSTFFSLLLRRLPLIWALFAGVVIAPLATWGYDVGTQATTAYDGVSDLAFGYDSAAPGSRLNLQQMAEWSVAV